MCFSCSHVAGCGSEGGHAGPPLRVSTWMDRVRERIYASLIIFWHYNLGASNEQKSQSPNSDP